MLIDVYKFSSTGTVITGSPAYFYERYWTLFYLPSLRFHHVGGRWDWTSNGCRVCIDSSSYSPLGYISSTTSWLPGSLLFLFLQAEDISRSLVGFRVPAILTVSTSVKNYIPKMQNRIECGCEYGLRSIQPDKLWVKFESVSTTYYKPMWNVYENGIQVGIRLCREGFLFLPCNN